MNLPGVVCMVPDFQKTSCAVSQTLCKDVKYPQRMFWHAPVLRTRAPITLATLNIKGALLHHVAFIDFQKDNVLRKNSKVRQIRTPSLHLIQVFLDNHCFVDTSQQIALKMNPYQLNKYSKVD